MSVPKNKVDILQVCKLIQCTRERNREQIKKLIESGIPNLIDFGESEKGETALIVAAKENDEDMVEYLTDSMGALPDLGDFTGATAAMRAAEYGHVQSLDTLIKAGANMAAVDKQGRNILFYCIGSTVRHAQCMQVALTAKADVNQPAHDGRTVFFAACETADKNTDCCLALLDAGAEPQMSQSGTLRTPLMVACSCGCAPVVQESLLRGADPNSLDKQGQTAGHYAAKAGHFDCLVRLSGFGANFNVYDSRQENPIHIAAANDRGICLRFLGQRGCDPRPKNLDGETARVIAKDKNNKDALKELRKAEKMFGKVDRWLLAVYDWSTVMAQALEARLRNEFDTEGEGFVTAEDFVQVVQALRAPWTDGCSKKLLPLYDKKKDGRFDYRDFFLAKKYINKQYQLAAFEPKGKKGKKGKGKGGRKKKPAKPPFEICTLPEDQMYRTVDGAPPIMYAPAAVNVTDTERFDRDRPPTHPLMDDSAWYVKQPPRTFVGINESAKHGDLESLKLALEKGYSVETRDKLYKTPLMVAAHYGNIHVAKFLLEAGADVNARDNFKWTPLHHACHAGMLDMVELLLANGANIDAVALNGATPLLRAIETSNVMVVSYLVNKGAKLLVENRKGESTSDLAKDWGNQTVIDIICTKFDLIAPAKDAKGKGGASAKKAAKKGSAKGKGGSSRQPQDPIVQAPPPPERVEDEEEAHIRRKARSLQDANALDGGYVAEEDVTVNIKHRWVTQQTTGQLLAARAMQRQRLGWQSDFDDFKTPFQRNIWEKIEEMGGPDED